jgi:hypothetical protein
MPLPANKAKAQAANKCFQPGAFRLFRRSGIVTRMGIDMDWVENNNSLLAVRCSYLIGLQAVVNK